MMAIYAAMIDEVDQNIGKLVTALRERRQLDNTLILFLSDNGGNAEAGVQGQIPTATSPATRTPTSSSASVGPTSTTPPSATTSTTTTRAASPPR